ncbi:hypothetical protein OH799_06740 [Nocardia sp. NBC_00881]|uniref:hypothetical protein n=1 Tax=Nocardia sp. NBC_00881 TaxID=2975995 RepID=UPI00386D0EF4|nr:hypothetical protein OH799_06740 [Nocardia sp. NBC_00881]
MGNLPILLDQLAKTFANETADAAHVDEDIPELKKSAEGVLTLYKDLARSCRAHRSAILKFRTHWANCWSISLRTSLRRVRV